MLPRPLKEGQDKKKPCYPGGYQGQRKFGGGLPKKLYQEVIPVSHPKDNHKNAEDKFELHIHRYPPELNPS